MRGAVLGGALMPVIGLRYGFRQPFRVPAKEAYRWCTDFGPSDAPLFGDRRERSVRWLSPDALMMTDVTWPEGHKLEICRLVRLFPEQRSWTNTHLTGPYRYSQYWYRVLSDGARSSHLEFQGLRLEKVARRPSAAALRARAEARRRSDASTWRVLLAPALHRELRPS